MKISYIPPVVVSATTDRGIIEEAIYNALQDTLVIPFQTWALETWNKIVDASFILCLSIAFAGAICGVLGIKKGYQVTVISIIFYLLLRLFSYLMGWC